MLSVADAPSSMTTLNNMRQDHIEQGGKKIPMNTDRDHKHETDRLWEASEQLPFIKELRAGRTVAEAMEQLDVEQAFKGECNEAGCADGRCQEHRFGIAGDGILLSEKELEEFVRKNKGKIAVVKSHDNCGAAAIKFKEIPAERLPIGVTTPDQLGIHHAKRLAEQLGAEYAHTSAKEMSGPVHNERVIYFDGTGQFNPGTLPELPAGFKCSGSALGLSSEYMEIELATLAKIALGNHGFGERFNRDNPLFIVVSAKNQDQLEALMKIAEKAAEQFNGRVAVDGFIAK